MNFQLNIRPIFDNFPIVFKWKWKEINGNERKMKGKLNEYERKWQEINGNERKIKGTWKENERK